MLYGDHRLLILHDLRSFSLGLAWTAMGGEIMFVEATRMGGEGKITLTGQLGRSITSWLFINFLRTRSQYLSPQRDNVIRESM